MNNILPNEGDISLNSISFSSLSESQLVDVYAGTIYKFCKSIAYSKEDADDLFQDTFILAFSHMSKIKRCDNPRNFLLSTAAYLWKSRQRKFARRKKLAPEITINEEFDTKSDNIDLVDDVITKEEQRIVRGLVDALPEKLKIPVILYYTNELSISDIATILKIPAGTVKSRLHKARKIIEKGLVLNYEYSS